MKLATTLVIGSLVAFTSCDRRTEPTTTGTPMETSTPATTASGTGAPAARPPEWVFDVEDPARDYVGRYLRSTMRYGDDTSCVVLGKSSFRGNESVVEVRNPADGSCGKAGELRDTFLANVSTDRLRVDDPEHRPSLKPWPDGSPPGSNPALLAEFNDMHGWKSPLHDVMKRQQLYPLRVQLYGRGTYPVITLAGWHALFDPKGDLAALKAPAQELCTASKGMPMAFFAKFDRQLLLRIDCPDRPHWDQLGL